ncbi:MAG: site-2 protease family protein, partial [Rickettsia endosymbiont of Ixodes persulcatus]|nr:site-2 protease family protein [Rickettsia endosymbiont of Ixodes persulcatus]
TFLARVPRVQLQEMKIYPSLREELTDWQFASGLNAIKFPSLLFIPYNLTNQGIVESPISFIDHDGKKEVFPEVPSSSLELPLLAGDKIIAVDGIPVQSAPQILKLIQKRQVHIIVERPQSRTEKISSPLADSAFDKSMDVNAIEALALSIGTNKALDKTLDKQGDFVLLKPITPKSHKEIYAASPLAEELNQALAAQKKQIAAIEDPLRKAELLKALDISDNKFELGIPIRDLKVEYNPVPTTQFYNVVKEISKTLKSLFTGSLNPKWMSGPVGIVNMFQEQTRSSLGDTLYWLGMISLNLGLLNLLPIPMLDGGTIVINLIELVTGKKIKPETLEKIILPFAVLLILFFIFLTYHDITRIFRK